jgi:hypothetical protein
MGQSSNAMPCHQSYDVTGGREAVGGLASPLVNSTQGEQLEQDSLYLSQLEVGLRHSTDTIWSPYGSYHNQNWILLSTPYCHISIPLCQKTPKGKLWLLGGPWE